MDSCQHLKTMANPALAGCVGVKSIHVNKNIKMNSTSKDNIIPTRYYIVDATNPNYPQYIPIAYQRYDHAKIDLNKIGCENCLILKGFDIIWRKLEPVQLMITDHHDSTDKVEKGLDLHRLEVPFKSLPTDTKERIGYWAKVKRRVRKTLKNL